MKIIIGGLGIPYPENCSKLDAFKDYYSKKHQPINLENFLTDAKEQLETSDYIDMYLIVYKKDDNLVEIFDKLVNEYSSKLEILKAIYIKYDLEKEHFLNIALNYLDDDKHKTLCLFLSEDI